MKNFESRITIGRGTAVLCRFLRSMLWYYFQKQKVRMGKQRTAITSKGQTTVPKAIRERLGVRPKDAIYWDVVDGEVRVSAGEPAFFRWIGAVRVGKGPIERDIAAARAKRAQRRTRISG